MSSAAPSLVAVLSAPHAMAVLGLPLSTTITDADVRAAYRAAALTWHPDKLANADAATMQSHGQAFIRVCEAFQAVKDADNRWKLVQQFREAEIWAEMKFRDDQDAAAAAKQKQERSAAAANTAPSSRESAGTASASAATAAVAAPSSAFPAFSGARFKPVSYTYRPGPSHTPAAASVASAAASSRAAAASAAATASARASAASVTASTIPVNDLDTLRSELTRWKLQFQQDMDAERDRNAQALMARFGGGGGGGAAGQPNPLEAKLGLSIFTQAAPPQSRPATNATGMQLQSTSAPAIAATSTNQLASSSAVSSRMQQMRDRQRGLVGAPSASAVASEAPPAGSHLRASAPARLDATSAALLSAGDRFRLRTVTASVPPSRPGALRPCAAPPAIAAPVPISLWLDPTHTMLQYRLTSSTHSHPDGVISTKQISEMRRLSKPVGGCWFSIVQRDGKSMTVEASTAEIRERWIAALEALVRCLSN